MDSRRGIGTRFTLKFPKVDSAIQQVPMSTWRKPTKRARLLIIDDEPNIRQLFRNMFPYGEHEITVASNGGQGIDLFRQGEFDVIFTDIGMPGMSGWEVARRIRTMDPLIPIIVITGWGHHLDQEKIRSSGIDLVLTKPFQVGKIFDTIAQAIELKARRARVRSKE